MRPEEFIAQHGYAGIAALMSKLDRPASDGSAALARPPATEQREIEWRFLRGRRDRLVGGEAFLYKWRSDGVVMP